MLRNKGLTNKVLLLGIDGMDPRFTKAMIDEGKMPNVKRLVERGSAREDLVLLGGMPTITPPMWATLATGAYPMTHGVIDYNVPVTNELDLHCEGFMSHFCKAEQLWNVTTAAGKKTLVFHWPGGAWPPTSDSPLLHVVDGSSAGPMGNQSYRRDNEMFAVATVKTTKGGYVKNSSRTSKEEDLNKDFDEFKHTFAFGGSNAPDPRLIPLNEEMTKKVMFQDFAPAKHCLVKKSIIYEYEEGSMYQINKFNFGVSVSPIKDAEGWANAPAGAKEFSIYFNRGKEERFALILQHEGKYDQVAVYSSKTAVEPQYVLDNDVYTPRCYDTMMYNDKEIEIVRNIRALEIREDGTFVKMWVGNANAVHDDRLWYPRSLYQPILEKFGPPIPYGLGGSQDADIIMKCNHPQWDQAGQWMADVMLDMIDREDYDVVFSHFHGPDLSGHTYMHYLKERPDSIVDEKEVRVWHENMHRWTDDYIGRFLPLLDKGWTILLFSDHSLVCPEHTPVAFGENGGINVGLMKELGYTVLKKDENGNEIKEIDWTKTRAVQTRSNAIYLNLKGRNQHTMPDGTVLDGIVDPADKYELEEQIITDLYGWKHPDTGKRIVAFALHNKDSVLLGMGGELAGDIVFTIHEGYNYDHGESISTAYGHNDTSVSPIFVAAGPGIKEGYTIDGYVREVDIAPTAAVLLGVDIPKDCDGAPAYRIFTERM
ncbi:MAG: alkaline phosphatase family protein [Peptococcaceae bacterium]|nr:alkaline phosphatase family protein [Peptococcaceae bacterium]